MLGFMQGRLVPPINKKIQAFPELNWQSEFHLGSELGLTLIEWTLDDNDLEKNPLLTRAGQSDIRKLSQNSGVLVKSVTGDCFMQNPFWKANHIQQHKLFNKFEKICEACAALNINFIVIPLVDDGALNTAEQERFLTRRLLDYQPYLENNDLYILFESDFTPSRLSGFIDTFPSSCFGINYDTGNSASLGYVALEELSLYGSRVKNVHIKDRAFGGGTLPLGSGAVDFDSVFEKLREIEYSGNFVIQAARSPTGDDVGIMQEYISFVTERLAHNDLKR